MSIQLHGNIRIVNMQKVIYIINPLNAELNPICYLLALLGAYLILHVSRIRVKFSTVFNFNP